MLDWVGRWVEVRDCKWTLSFRATGSSVDYPEIQGSPVQWDLFHRLALTLSVDHPRILASPVLSIPCRWPATVSSGGSQVPPNHL